MIQITELLRQHIQKKILFVGYRANCRLIERELVGNNEKEFQLVRATEHYHLEKIAEMKSDIILFDLIEVYMDRGPEIVDKIIRYYRKFWVHALRKRCAKKVVILFSFHTKEETASDRKSGKKAYQYRHPWALVATRAAGEASLVPILDKSWFMAVKTLNKDSLAEIPAQRDRVLIESIWDYMAYEGKVANKEVEPLEKLTSSARDYALILRQIESVKKEP